MYGGTYNQFKISFPRLGINVKFAEDDSLGAIEKLIDDKTKLIFIETIGNPGLNVYDIRAVADLAHKYNIPLMVYNTFGCAGYICRPFDYGADIIVHSTTKW